MHARQYNIHTRHLMAQRTESLLRNYGFFGTETGWALVPHFAEGFHLMKMLQQAGFPADTMMDQSQKKCTEKRHHPRP